MMSCNFITLDYTTRVLTPADAHKDLRDLLTFKQKEKEDVHAS